MLSLLLYLVISAFIIYIIYTQYKFTRIVYDFATTVKDINHVYNQKLNDYDEYCKHKIKMYIENCKNKINENETKYNQKIKDNERQYKNKILHFANEVCTKASKEVKDILTQFTTSDLDTPLSLGETIIFNAVRSGSLELVRYLVENKKVDFDLDNCLNQKPIDIATGDIKEYLEEQYEKHQQTNEIKLKIDLW